MEGNKLTTNAFEFLKAADYAVDSVGLAFIVPSSQVDAFHITPRQVESSGVLHSYARYGIVPTEEISQKHKHRWMKLREHDHIHVYSMDVTSMNYPKGT
jgi:hypothetical protein